MALLSDEEVQDRLEQLETGWRREGDAIVRQFQFEDFQGSVDFVNRIAAPANEMNHHPDLEISWNKVIVLISSHSEGGITANDFELADAISDLE